MSGGKKPAEPHLIEEVLPNGVLKKTLLFQEDTRVWDAELKDATAEPEHEAIEAAWLRDGCVRVGLKRLRLIDTDAAVLKTLVQRGPLSMGELRDHSGYDRAERILKDCCGRYDGLLNPYITFPGKKGKGGYRTTIRES